MDFLRSRQVSSQFQARKNAYEHFLAVLRCFAQTQDLRPQVSWVRVMIYRLLADLLIIVHFLWILFILCGFLLALKSFKLSLIHIGGLIFTLILNLGGWYCPLTHLENYMQGLYDPQLAYSGSFIINRLERIIYLNMDEAYLRLAAILWVAANVAGYLVLAKKRMQGHRRRA